jgi:putative glutamine amidotransferase
VADRPIIGITSGETINKKHPLAPPVQGQQFTYTEAVERAGGVPLLLPIVKSKKVLRRIYDMCDSVIFAGGNDIHPSLYGKKLGQNATTLHKERDIQEQQLLLWALEEGKPILAICRGMQMLNITLGGSLYQDIPTDLPDADDHEKESDHWAEREHHIAHHLRIKGKSKLAEIMGTDPLATNAYHHQAVRELGKGLVPTAWAEDGIIEAVELPDKGFVLGVQSHPEALEAKIEPRWRKLFVAFIKASKTN